MTPTPPDLLALTKNYLAAIEAGETGDELAVFYAESVEQIEYPNRLMPNGARRNLSELKAASLRGKEVLISQSYDIQNSYVWGNTVILEMIWTAKIAVPFGSIPAGGEMKAYFAQFIEFEGEKIVRQRTYDCFEPF